MKKRIISLILLICLTFSVMSVLSGCGSSGDQAFVIMTDTLDGLFNPFFSTSASDGTIVSMTQMGMLSSDTDEKRELRSSLSSILKSAFKPEFINRLDEVIVFNYLTRSKDRSGGSTITQQLVKNLTGNDERMIERKISEAFCALDLEKKYDKTEIDHTVAG